MHKKKWFILKYKRKAHKKAEENLTRQGFRTFHPVEETIIRKYNKYSKSVRPLFPGYLFVEFDPLSSASRKINNTLGVSGIISFNSKFTEIPFTIIAELKTQYCSSGKTISSSKLTKGDLVEFTSGPFTNYCATIEKLENTERIWVLIAFLGQKTKMQTSANKVKLIS
jgi:transcriptional antiterminator RfaH